MITVPDATKKIVERSRYLSEAISKGLINYSALARYIKPELEEMLVKNISDASIIMALKRLEGEFRPKFKQVKIFKNTPEMIMRGSLFIVGFSNENFSGLSLLLSRESDPKSLYLKNQGIHETSVILSRDLYEKYEATILEKGKLLSETTVTAITIYLPEEALASSGIYYFFLKSLAWEGINILEVTSTYRELTLIIEDRDAERTFVILKSLFKAD